MSTENWRGLESWQLDPISIKPKLDYGKLEVILRSRGPGLWHLVDGTEAAPVEGFALERWELRDACARLQFVFNIPDRWVWMVQQARTAREMRTAIRDHFQIESQLKKRLALNRFGSAKCKESQDIPAHVQRWAGFGRMSLPHRHPCLEALTRTNTSSPRS
jgi:hypothetical protein